METVIIKGSKFKMNIIKLLASNLGLSIRSNVKLNVKQNNDIIDELMNNPIKIDNFQPLKRNEIYDI